MFKLLGYAKEYRRYIIIGPVFKFIEAIFELFLPLMMANLIDYGINKGDKEYVLRIGFWMFIMSCAGLAAVFICQYAASVASLGFGTALRLALMEKIAQLSYEELDCFDSVALSNHVTYDVNQMQTALAMFIRLVIRAPFLSIGALVMSFYIDPKLAFIFVILLPIFIVIVAFILLQTTTMYRKLQEKLDKMAYFIEENVRGVRVIRAFVQKRRKSKKVVAVMNDFYQVATRLTRLTSLLNPVTMLMMNFGMLFLLYLGGQQVYLGKLSQGEVLALLNYFVQMLLAMTVVTNLVVLFARAKASASRINEVFALPTPQESTVSMMPNDCTHLSTVKMLDVSFRYKNNRQNALTNIHFSMGSNEMVGIVGETGSGKSTLVQLISRLYDVSQGTILIDDQPIEAYSFSTLQHNIGFVSQEATLFSGTIASNLRVGKENATEEEIIKALKITQSWSFVQQLDNGIHHVVQENGRNFSGGQKQRLAIARAVVKEPSILILDDSLSALDYHTEGEIRRGLKKHLPNTTILMVSQRIPSIIHSDKIYVLSKGRVQSVGTHTELLKASNQYREMYQSQRNKGD